MHDHSYNIFLGLQNFHFARVSICTSLNFHTFTQNLPFIYVSTIFKLSKFVEICYHE